MRKFVRIAALLVSIVLILIAASAAYIKLFLPNTGPPPEITVVSTPEHIERGRYLANNVMVCMDCHSSRDWNKISGPIIPGTFGKGGDRFDQSMGFPGIYFAANITPAGLKSWTDGEIFRAITTGVRKNGKPIFPVMPHSYYGTLDEEDIKAVIAYLRTLSPIENTPPESKSDFPMNFIINTIPKKATLSKRPSPDNAIEYGRYITQAASCKECHTPFEKGSSVNELAFAGGRSFPMPAGTITSANITRDKETGIGNWTKEMFIEKFKSFNDSAVSNSRVNSLEEYNTIMPWAMYAGMKEGDIGAMFDYLQSLEPKKQAIVKFVAGHPNTD